MMFIQPWRDSSIRRIALYFRMILN